MKSGNFHKNLYVIENALRNVAKNKGRNLLQGAMIFAVITATVIALSIHNTSNALISEYQTRLGSEASIVYERRMQGGNSNLASFTAEQTLAFSQSEYLQSTDMSSSLACRSDTLAVIDQSDQENSVLAEGSQSYGGDVSCATMRLRGGAYQDFSNKLRKLSEGAMPEADSECIVSMEFAALNELSIGDPIPLTAGLFDADQGTRDVDIPLTLVGTYADATEEYSGAVRVPYRNRRNEILTTFDTVLNAQGDHLSGVAAAATYYLKSPDMLEAFAAEIHTKGLPSGYRVETDNAGYHRMVMPMMGLKDISLTFLLIVLVLGGAIMMLLSVIAVRERKYEIGVLRAMGMKKRKLAMGLWVEIIVITCCCFLLGMIAGGLLSQPISDALLAGKQSLPLASASAVKPQASIHISTGPLAALEIFGVAVLLASIAGVVSVSHITKYEPIKILMERN